MINTEMAPTALIQTVTECGTARVTHCYCKSAPIPEGSHEDHYQCCKCGDVNWVRPEPVEPYVGPPVMHCNHQVKRWPRHNRD